MSTFPISLESLRGCPARGALAATIGLAILSCSAWMPAAAQDPAPPASSAADSLPDVDLSGALLYQLMAAEAAAQRGDLGAAYSIYLKLARDTSDPRLARRAAELALQGRALSQALEAARLWHQLAPTSTEAGQTLAMLFAANARFDDAYPLFHEQLQGAPRPAEELLRIQRALALSQDRAGAFAMLEKLAAPYLASAEVRLVLASGAHAAGLATRAAEEARAAAASAPDDERTLLTAAQILQSADRPTAKALLVEYLGRHPDAANVRLAMARMLIADNQFDAARAEFGKLLAADPNNAELVYSMALLSLQGDLRADARRYLHRYLALAAEPGATGATGPKTDAAHLYLAQIAEDEKDYGDALQWLRRIEAGDEYLTARVREAIVLGKMKRVDDGRKLLRSVAAESDEDRTRLVLAEAQLLRDARRYDESYRLLADALEKSPDSVALLYDTAMAAEKTNQIDVMEKRLRRLIELRPDHAHAYNALGYTFAERNIRLEEALKLIEKALELAPDDAYILDSMGWVHYRLGNLKLAREFLERSYALKPEAEVAVHLAEVLWVAGERERSRELLRGVRSKEPDNELLRSTLARLRISL
jgi:tetratricopeptide (TPR) repeat protein